MPLLKLQLNKINEQNHKRELGAKEGVPSENVTWGNMNNIVELSIEIMLIFFVLDKCARYLQLFGDSNLVVSNLETCITYWN